jgi:hypothetical protein
METSTYIAQRASGLYEKLIRLYPSSYRKKHRDELLQNFDDLRRDIGSGKLLWAFIISDFVTSLGKEYMQYIKNHFWLQILIAAVVILGALFTWQVLYLQKAHSTFDNYAAFRGCEQITSETATSGTCALSSGQSITIVKFDNRWFLQGDLPVCMIQIGSHCLINQP